LSVDRLAKTVTILYNNHKYRGSLAWKVSF
jgi:hypothetical protein